MAGYGYSAPSYGYYKPPAPPRPSQSGLLSAVTAGRLPPSQDPFGLHGTQNDPAQSPNAPGRTPLGGPSPSARTMGARSFFPAAPGSVAGASGASGSDIPQAGQAAYDLNTDPMFQQVQALTGMNDEQARAAALKQKQDRLLGYGDPNLVSSLLGDTNLAAAAGRNPTSTLAQLRDQRGRNLTDLTEGLNKANLLYSGYRVNQEDQAGRDYQNALASAASGVNGDLGSIDAQLAAALGQNQSQRLSAMQDAYGRHATDAGPSAADLTSAVGPSGPDLASAAAGGNTTSAPIDPSTLATLQRLLRGGGTTARAV